MAAVYLSSTMVVPVMARGWIMQGSVTIEVAPGELVDKLTILDIKLLRLTDAAQRLNVEIERRVLHAACTTLDEVDGLSDLRARLHAVNETLWTIEDDIRECERRGDFGPRFVDLARAVYKTNDARAALKRAINVALGSRLIEEKSYAAYV